MMPTSITTANGLVVVTQVFPREGNDHGSQPNVPPQIQIQSPKPPAMTITNVSKMTTTFLRGEPQSLGIVQMFIGLIFVVVNLSALFSSTSMVQMPLLMGIAFVLSGSLTVASRKGTISCLIRGTLAVNVISVLVALYAIAYLCMLFIVKENGTFCRREDDRYNSDRGCEAMYRQLLETTNVIRGLMLVLAVLEVCLAITVCVFSGKALSRHESTMIAVVVESGGAPTTSAASMNISGEPLLGCEKVVAIPPPYSP